MRQKTSAEGSKALKKSRRPNGYWHLETLMESSKMFSTVTEWSKADMGAYMASRKLGLFKDVTAHMLSHAESISKGRTTWTRAACLESAKKYSTRVEWETKDPAAYLASRRYRWFEECTQHMIRLKQKNGHWTLASCLEEAKKYETISDWIKASGSSYQAAIKNQDWFLQCTKHMTKLWKKKWDENSILEDAKRFSTLQEWTRDSIGAYSAALKKGLVRAATAHMIKNPRWLGVATIHRILKAYDIDYIDEKTFEDCRDKRKLPFDFFLPIFNLVIENQGTQHQRGWQGRGAESIKRRDAIKRKYCDENRINFLEIKEWEISSEEEFEMVIIGKLKSLAPNQNLVKRSLTSEERLSTQVRENFNLVQLETIALQYDTRAKLKRANEPAYNFACRHDLIDQICKHMQTKSAAQSQALKKWTLELVKASALRFNTSREWAKGEGSAYNAARREGWLPEVTSHFPRSRPR
jgi:hypothetical protein